MSLPKKIQQELFGRKVDLDRQADAEAKEEILDTKKNYIRGVYCQSTRGKKAQEDVIGFQTPVIRGSSGMELNILSKYMVKDRRSINHPNANVKINLGSGVNLQNEPFSTL